MLFTRQRLLLTLLDTLGGSVGQTDFQKLLFLYTQECEETASYEFVPYRFGGFSFTSYADKRRLVNAGLLEADDQHWRLSEPGRVVARKQAIESLRVGRFCQRYARLRGYPLVAEVYRRFPYYALRSEILDQVLTDPEERARVAAVRPTTISPGLLTIGYEGRCLEGYLNDLIRAGVTRLCDVRRNPLSRKYGFSKGTLSKSCEPLGIRYHHLPELGIASEQRRELKTQADYDALFAIYERDNLPRQALALARIRDWVVKDGERVALTCFERRPHQCHRHCVAKAVAQIGGRQLVPSHL
jgi:hypothetical protein